MSSSSPKLFFWALTAALAGFLFGFDTVVISGAEKKIEELWGLTPALHGLAMSAALWGTVIGSLGGAWPADWYGRKRVLILIGLFYLVSAIWSALANDVHTFIIARFLGGLGVGVSTVVAPLYISEMAPADRRGRLTGLFQFNIVFGILVAFASNSIVSGFGEHAWRWMLGIEAIPAIIYSVLCLTLPESPRWLITRKKAREEGTAVLAAINPSASREDLEKKAEEIVLSANTEGRKRGFWSSSSSLKRPITLAFLIAFFNQLSGINAILYFAPRIFEMAGLAEKSALLQSIGIGVTNLIFTFVGLWLIDRMGRRKLLVIGSFGYIASLGLCSWAFYSGNTAIVPVCIFAFIAAHAVGQGAVIWVFISEIFPNQHRAAGQAFGCGTHWVFAALLTLFFPTIVEAFHPGTVFAFFAGMMCLQLLWVKLMVPETKGRSLEELERALS